MLSKGTNHGEAERPGKVAIAICGVGMRLPGGIRDSTAFYDFLLNGRDARKPVPKERFNIDGFYDARGKPGSLPIQQGYWIDDVDLSHFDSSMFSMGRGEVENLDPQQRLLLEVVRETFESAAETNWRGKNIGCYAASYGEEWSNLRAKDAQSKGFSVYTGYMDLMQSNRISFEYDLRGPSMTLRTGCSGTGLGIHLACQSIQLGECSSAIVAGANILISPETTMFMSDGGALSPDASSKTFDASANGYVRAEGINCLYIKRLDDAIRDGNPVRAVIRATSTNVNGRSASLTSPNIDAQEALIRSAYRSGDLEDPSLTAMVECHGTGTSKGDAAEAGAVARVFGKRGIYIGSVKPNLGHSEGASANNSVIKAIVQLENRTILPNIKFETPNPNIPWDEARLVVPVQPLKWPEGRLERISINSYGIGGSNVHIVLDSAASYGLPEIESKHTIEPDFKLLLLSAGHPDSLKQMQLNYQAYAASNPYRLDDLAYTLAHRREHLPVRGFCITKGVDKDDGAMTVSPPFANQSHQKVVFVFTGQGAQWSQMGKELLQAYPEVLRDIRDMDRLLQKQDNPPDWTIEEQLTSPGDLIAESEVAQPVCTALQVALCNLLCRWEVSPAGVVGHSSGEIAAAYAAGSLNMHDAILLAYYRGMASKAQTRIGAMAAVGLTYDEVTKWLQPGVVIACENSPSSVTLSGDADALDSVLSMLRKQHPDAFQRLLNVNKAYHSHHMKEVGQLYDRLVKSRLSPQTPKVPFYSTVTTQQQRKANDFGSRYWRQNLESPVWFFQGFDNLLQSGAGQDALFLEIGPHSALAGPINQILRARNASNTYLSVLTRNSNALVDFLSCVGELYARGVYINYPLPSYKLKALHDLPLYPWHYKENLWAESRSMKASRFQKYPHHDLLGVRTIESSDLEPVWRNVLHLGRVPWLRDHCVESDIVFPAAAYIATAGHAVWQLTGLRDFTVRNVSFKSAMVLDENQPTEIITSLRPHRLTDSLYSTSFEFSIQSHSGSVWIQHCSGLVAGGQASRGPRQQAKTYSRVVETKRWYRATSKAGLKYGPSFACLDRITASARGNLASAILLNHEFKNTLHPVTIDLILQLSIVARFQGLPMLLKRSGLPTFIEEMYIQGGQEIHANVAFQGQSSHGQGVANDKLAFFLKGLEFSEPSMDDDQQNDQHETAQLVWKPHFEFANPSKLVKPAQNELPTENPFIERIFLLCIIDAIEDIKDIAPVSVHLETYRAWMTKQVAHVREHGHPLVPDAKRLLDLESNERRALIKKLVADHNEGTMVAGSRIMIRCYENMASIFKGETDPLELMQRDGLLREYYDSLQDKHEHRDFLQLLGHFRPKTNILEIGAGTGGLTAKILSQLRSESGDELYREYTFTDISSGFFVKAKERFRDHPRIRYDVLDISKNPLEQGFSKGYYDLIIAANVLHATPFLTETLKNTRTLLKPDGRLLLQELCPVSKWTNFIFGLFSGWWLGKDDDRADEPYISPKNWELRLREAGFAGVDASALDADYPHQLNTMLIAKPFQSSFSPKSVTILSMKPSHAVVQALQQCLSSAGYKIDLNSWGEKLAANQDIVALLDLDIPFFDSLTTENLTIFLQIIKQYSPPNILWVTHSAQINPQNPRFGHVLGVARTLRSELGVPITTLEMQDFGHGSIETILAVLHHIQSQTAEMNEQSEFDPDREFAWHNGAVHVGRMQWLSISDALVETSAINSVFELEIGRPGLLNTLRWVSQPARPLQPDEVQIKVMSVSLNFKELLVAMGVVPMTEGQGLIGTDSAGVVTAIGPSVTNVSVGDRVMALSVTKTSYTTSLHLSSKYCTRIPDKCSFEDASTLPTVYLTVLRTLREKANLQRGQSVLIHSAAGGVGIAAIHYAKSIGAILYATVSSPTKKAFLTKILGVDQDHIFQSRDNTFLDSVMRATDGRGVDVVLNSLSGEQLHASWNCVAKGGVMVEIGKRDLLGRAQLAMNPFLDNRSYIGVDIATLAMAEPEWAQLSLATIVDLYNQGSIRPIRPTTPFPANKVEDAFRYLQKGQHIGKLTLLFADSPDLPLAPRTTELSLRADKSYLLVGGLRGIGSGVARWMASHGAKHLAFLSRSAGQRSEDKALVQELSDMGCQVQTFTGDVADLATVRQVASSTANPIAGVMQLAMVLADTSILDMNIETWNKAIRPKVDGTWNLHEALPPEMDFFVMASSLSGIFGQYGQANYAAANTFLDAFAQFRLSKGLAASTVDLGVVDEIGYVSLNAAMHRKVVQQMSTAVSEESLLDCFKLAIIRSHPSKGNSNPSKTCDVFRAGNQLLHGILSKSGTAKGQYIWQRDPRTALSRVHLQNEDITSAAGEADGNGFKGLLAELHDNPELLHDTSTVQTAAREIAHQVTIYTMRGGDELDLSLSLSDLGVDSLVSIEIRNWWKQAFGSEVTVLQLMGGGSLLNLGEKAIDQLKRKYITT